MSYLNETSDRNYAPNSLSWSPKYNLSRSNDLRLYAALFVNFVSDPIAFKTGDTAHKLDEHFSGAHPPYLNSN